MTLILIGLSRAVEVENQDWGDAAMAKSGHVYKESSGLLAYSNSLVCIAFTSKW